MVVFLCYCVFWEGYWIAGEYLGSSFMARSIWGNHVLRGCFATELGELLDEDQLILQTAITLNVKSQKGEGAELHTKNVEELNLLFIRLLYIHITHFKNWAVLESVYLLKIRVVFSLCWDPLLMAHQCLELIVCFLLCSHALISSIIFICLCTYFPRSSDFFFPQVHFLARLFYLYHRLWDFVKKPRSWICAEEIGEEDVVTASTSLPLSKALPK